MEESITGYHPHSIPWPLRSSSLNSRTPQDLSPATKLTSGRTGLTNPNTKQTKPESRARHKAHIYTRHTHTYNNIFLVGCVMGFKSRIEDLRSAHRPYLDSPNPEKIHLRFPSYVQSLLNAPKNPPPPYDPCLASLPGLVHSHPMNLMTNVVSPRDKPLLNKDHNYTKEPVRHLPLVCDAAALPKEAR